MTNPTDPAAVDHMAVTKQILHVVMDNGGDLRKGPRYLDGMQVLKSYGDQREKAAVERVVAWLRGCAEMHTIGGILYTAKHNMADAIERGDFKNEA